MMRITIFGLMLCILFGTVFCWNEGYDNEHEGVCPNDVRCNNIPAIPTAIACNNIPTSSSTVICASVPAIPTAIACNNIPTPSSVACAPVPTAIACAGGTVACSTDCQIVGLLQCLITSILAALDPIITALTAFPTTLIDILALPGAIATLLTSIATALRILLDPTTGLLACFTGLCSVAP